ncbi:MAG: hypothetical protein RLY31_157 [Bacteroidota bacterium]|jgi:uncharacterized membrane protein YhhN
MSGVMAFRIYMVLAGSEMLAEAAEWRLGTFLFKPMLMPALAWAFRLSVGSAAGSFERRILWALLFSWLGDMLLLLVPLLGPAWFVYGLAAFLTAHLWYIGAFAGWSPGGSWLRRHPWSAIPFVLYLVALTVWWWSSLGGLRWPVVAYSMVITVMGLSAWNLRDVLPAGVFRLLSAGAVLFILSDSLIAVDKFRQPIPVARIWIMLTYMGAQYLIVRAAVGMVTDRSGRGQP